MPKSSGDGKRTGSVRKQREGDGLGPVFRHAGEPPPSFPYDHYEAVDVFAWAAVCPNFYEGPNRELVVSRSRYELCLARGEVGVFRKGTQERVVESDPDPEDTEEVREAYLAYRKRLRALGVSRFMYPNEDRPTAREVVRVGSVCWPQYAAGAVKEPLALGQVLARRGKRHV